MNEEGTTPAQPVPPTESRPAIRWLNYVFALGKGVIILFVLGALVQSFIATPFRISGISMDTNFHDGEFVLVDKLSYVLNEPQRGDPIVLKFPADPSHLFIKRIVGLPGETVKIDQGRVFINNQPLVESYLPEAIDSRPDQIKVLGYDEYWVMGDNRPNSNDSRYWGVMPKDDIVGIVRFSLSPGLFGWIAQPAY